MILAILQQANYSQHLQLGVVAGIGLQLAQDGIEQEGLMLDAFSNLLTDARGSVARVQARLGNARAPSVVPASLAFHVCVQPVSLPICMPVLCHCCLTMVILLLAILPDCPHFDILYKEQSSIARAVQQVVHDIIRKNNINEVLFSAGKDHCVHLSLASCLDQEAGEATGSCF